MKFIDAFKKILTLATPMICSRLIGTAIGVVAMIMIAELGEQALAASALVTAVSMTLFLISWAVLFSTGVFIGPLFAKKEYEEVGKVFRQSLILGAIISVPLMILFWVIGPCLSWFDQDPVLIKLTTQYLRVLAFSAIPSMWFVGFVQFTAGVLRPRVVIYTTFVELSIMTFFGYGLLFGKFGMPRLGMVGMAYANVIAYWVGIAFSLIYLKVNNYFYKFSLFKNILEIDFKYIKQLFIVGYPIALQLTSELTAFSFSTIMTGWFGVTGLAGQQIVTQIAAIMLMIPIGISQASAILISQSIAKNDFRAVKMYNKAAVGVGMILIWFVGAIYVIFPKEIMELFSVDVSDPNNAELVRITILLFLSVAISQILDTIRNVMIGSLRAFLDTKFPMWNSFICSWIISVPTGYFLAKTFNLGAVGIRSGYIIGWAFGAIVLVMRFNKNVYNLKKSIIKKNNKM